MMECNIKVNGSLIANIYLHNMGYVGEGSDLCNYEYEVYTVSKGLKSGELKHYRSAGWKILIKNILEDVLKDD